MKTVQETIFPNRRKDAMTIKDIARLAGVSVATVSKVINHKDQNISDETRKKIETVIVKNNYVPYKKVIEKANDKSKLIALLISDVSDIFCSELLKGVEDYCFTKGYSIIICNTDSDAEKERLYIHQLTKQNVQGIIRFLTPGTGKKDLEYLEHNNIHNVVLDDINNSPNVLKTFFNNKQGGYLATNHLIENGHNKIGYITPISDLHYLEERFAGYREALQKNHLVYLPNLVFHSDTDNRDECGYDGAQYLLAQNATAIFCSDDHIAVGAYRAIREYGLRIPNDISVIGFDDTLFCNLLNPPLSSVRQSAYHIGQSSAKLLYKKITHAGIDTPNVQIEPQLITRESVGIPSHKRTAMQKVYVICGNIYANIILHVESKKTNARQKVNTVEVTVGGNVAEKAKSLLCSDTQVYILGYVGNDDYGRKMYQDLQKMGIKTIGLLFLEHLSTGLNYITKNNQITESSVVLEGATLTSQNYPLEDYQWICNQADKVYCEEEHKEYLLDSLKHLDTNNPIVLEIL